MSTLRHCCTLLVLACTPLLHAQEGAKWVVPPVIENADEMTLAPQDVSPFFMVKYQGLYGLYDHTGRNVLPVEYGSITLHDANWIQVYDDGKQVLYNPALEEMSRLYDRFRVLNGGVAVVYKDKRCGLINQQGEELVPVEYERMAEQTGVYNFYKGDEVRTYVPAPAQQNPQVAAITLEKAQRPVPGLTKVQVGKLSGFLNAKGDTVIPAAYTLGSIWREKGFIVASFDQKTWGIIDKQHQTIFPFTADRMGGWTQSGLLPVKFERQWGVQRFPQGEVVIPFGNYDLIETYDAAKEWFRVTKNKLQGIVDARGNVLLPLAYTYVSQSDHVTHELAAPDGKRGYWYIPANRVVEPQYNYVGNLNDSLCIITKDNQTALINVATGREIIPFSPFGIEKRGPYFVTDFKYDPTVGETAGGRLHGLYDRQGNLLFAPDSVDIAIFPDHSYYVQPHTREVTIKDDEHRTAQGQIIRTSHRIETHLRDGCWIAYTSMPNSPTYQYGVFTALDAPGQEQWYTKVGSLVENVRVVVDLNGKYGLTSNTGKVLLPTVFDKILPSKHGYLVAKYAGKWGVLQNPQFDYFTELRK